MAEKRGSSPDTYDRYSNLRADCENCFGLCCAALYFAASEGFPTDKMAGHPCPNLQSDFCCCVHETLKEKGYKGCISFDCFGAGQKVSQVSFAGNDWRKDTGSAKQMFDVFLIMRQLHELLWYLTEALTLKPASSMYNELSSMLEKTEECTRLNKGFLMNFNIAEHREGINVLLLKASELAREEFRKELKIDNKRKKSFGPRANLIGADLRKVDLRGANLRGACLIAANLRESDLSETDFIGADLRDADIRDTDLSKSIFLTQGQINSAKGSKGTKIPSSLIRPIHWED